MNTRTNGAIAVLLALILSPLVAIAEDPSQTQPAIPPATTAPTTAPAPRPLSANELLSADELHKLVDAGQYKDALRGLARPLALRGAAAGAYDRHDLLMMKAECLVQTHDNAGAIATLALVRKESTADNKPEEALLADAFVELLQKSPGGTYLPKTGSSRLAIKILDRSLRKSAYDALFADQFALFQQKATAAANAKKLPPYMDAAKFAAALRAVEFASTGSNTQSSAAMKELADGALKLITDTLDDLEARETRISTAANRETTQTVNAGFRGTTYPQNRTTKAGLTGNDAPTLRDIINTCKQIPQATQELANAFGTEQDTFKAAANRAEDIKSKANVTLTTDYTGYVNGN